MKSFIFILGLALVATMSVAQRRPPNYSQEYMPETSFDCRDKILGGYYADIETDCQMFHVCVKVPGIGVQDFRFLCPNDTSFDQENQICASWYEVNCDPGILFYSDNFDLYRIGYSPSSPALVSSSAAPIALGPSTARPLSHSRPRPRPGPREDEEEFYLQRSDTGDRRLQNGKDLRSSSTNYFGRNKGKEDEYSGADSYLKKTAKPYKPVAQTTAAPTTFYTDSPTTAKKKVAVRKLRKRPQQGSFQTDEDTTVAQAPAFRGQPAYSAPKQNYDYSAAPSSQAPPPAEDNYAAYTPRYNTIQRNPQPTTQSPAYDATYQNNYNNYNFAQRGSSAKPAEYTTTSAPASSYQTAQRKTPEYSTTLQNSNSNYYQGDSGSTASSGTYQSTPNYQSGDYTNNGRNYNYDFSGTYTSTVAPQSYDQYNYQTAARGSSKLSTTSPTTSAAPAYSNFQTTSEAYKYDNYNGFQRTVQAQYNAQPGSEDESLKTAQSSNYGPSSLNNYQNTYDKASKPAANNYNYTGNNYYTSSATPKTSASSGPGASSRQQSTAAPPRPFSAAYSPTAPAASTDYRTSTTAHRRQPTTPTPTASSTKNVKDVSYDYAYYDEANTEYDGLDPISDHHFGKGRESFKVARATTR